MVLVAACVNLPQRAEGPSRVDCNWVDHLSGLTLFQLGGCFKPDLISRSSRRYAARDTPTINAFARSCVDYIEEKECVAR